MNNLNSSNPCTDKLTDLEYLEHMIPHHQVAIDMSNLLIPKIRDPVILHLCRNIIRKQEYEIWEMTLVKKRMIQSAVSNEPFYNQKTTTCLQIHNPCETKSKDGDCNPLFFKPDDHMKHMEHMEVNEKSYLEHMIPHHQVAVDMSKRLLMHSNNSYLVDFCKKLIIDQQYEIFMMNNMLKNKYNYKSLILD